MDEKEGGGNEDGEEDKGGEIKQKRDVIHEEAGEQMLRGERNAREDVLHSHPHDEHGEHTDDDQDHDSPSLENSEENPLREESELDLRDHLRDDILESVDECLSAWEKGRAPSAEAAPDPLHRCVVCTLPYGGCKHTLTWLEGRDQSHILDELPKDNIDLTMEDISDVLTPSSLLSKGINVDGGDPSLANLRWETLNAQPADELAGKKVDLSRPSSRSGHTMVLLKGAGNLREDTRILVVFGGVSTTNIDTRGCRTTQHTLIYYADVRVFNLGLSTWHCPDASGDLPVGRYGHTALALDDDTMWMFGGRLQGGLQAGDTYTLNVRGMRWEKTNAVGDGDLSPAPRFWSAAVKVRQQVVLFGGADLLNGQIFEDVWTWDIQTRCWTEQIVVGTPPLARYGHVMLACPEGQVLVLGGCCVSTTAEDGLPADHDLLHLRVRVAANMVNRAYELEEAEIAVGAVDSYKELGGSIPASVPELVRRGGNRMSSRMSEKKRWRSLSQQQARLAAAVAARESDTTLREEELREVLYEQAAMTYWAKLRSQHPLKEMDMMFLDTDSMIWGVGNPPPVGVGKTKPPSARMQFSAVLLGRKVVLWGGCLPTSKRVDIVDGDVHVFDLDTRRWSTPVGECHPEGLRSRFDAAVGQLRRAERALFEATQRAMTMGAPAGRTMQVVQAEAIIEVNRWRVLRIEDTIRSAAPSPRPRAAHVGCAIGHRVFYLGGWGSESENGSLLVLDIEQPNEKERRLEEEFHLRLERERQQRESAEVEALRRAARQEEMRKGTELAREAAETAAMIAEDTRSAIAELTIAPTPRLRCANSTTLWLEWDRPTIDASGNSPDRRVEYILYMCGGFCEWDVGDHVLVKYLSRAQRKAITSKSTISTNNLTDTDSLAGGSLLGGALSSSMTPGGVGAIATGGGVDKEFKENHHQTASNSEGECTRTSEGHHPMSGLLPAVITNTSVAGGLFDIRWDDGECERGVRRNRIYRPASPCPPWTIIYHGEDRRYVVEGMVPECVIERERDFSYEVSANFSLQTKGAEVPRDRLSRHSPVVTLRTSFDGQGPRDDLGRLEKGGRAPAGVQTRLAKAIALDDSISASGGAATRSLSSGPHPLHGQYVAIGKGGSYI